VAKDKLYYKIGEACKLLDIQPYVLRYWETEFPILSPNKSKSGQRVYGDVDFALIRRIKELLYEEGFTIAGAKKKLEGEIAAGGPKLKAVPAEKAATKPAKAAPKAAGPAAAKAAPDQAATAEAGELERVKAGVEKALEEARAILSLLEG
jgi:DNA-binding transcriptional MerR regulator